MYTTLGIGVHCVSVHSTLVCTMPWCTLCLSLHYASVYTISQCTPCRCTVYPTVQSTLVYTLYILLKQTFCTSLHFYLLYIYNIIYKYMNISTYIPICFLSLPRLHPPFHSPRAHCHVQMLSDRHQYVSLVFSIRLTGVTDETLAVMTA